MESEETPPAPPDSKALHLVAAGNLSAAVLAITAIADTQAALEALAKLCQRAYSDLKSVPTMTAVAWRRSGSGLSARPLRQTLNPPTGTKAAPERLPASAVLPFSRRCGTAAVTDCCVAGRGGVAPEPDSSVAVLGGVLVEHRCRIRLRPARPCGDVGKGQVALAVSKFPVVLPGGAAVRLHGGCYNPAN